MHIPGGTKRRDGSYIFIFQMSQQNLKVFKSSLASRLFSDTGIHSREDQVRELNVITFWEWEVKCRGWRRLTELFTLYTVYMLAFDKKID